jgi:hypothetical protein
VLHLNLIPCRPSPGIVTVDRVLCSVLGLALPTPSSTEERRQHTRLVALLRWPVLFHRLDRYPRRIGVPLAGMARVVGHPAGDVPAVIRASSALPGAPA